MRETTHFRGDEAEYTGEVLQLHGGVFYEVLLIEGHMVGQFRLVTTAPKDDDKELRSMREA